MPYMIGPAPIRRTLKYLKMGTIVFRENVKIFTINYNKHQKHHEGARDFIFWHLSQIQFKNPEVQCLTFKDMTPSPFIRVFLEGGNNVVIDIDSRSKEEILNHLENFTAICKHRREIENYEKDLKKNITQYFGIGCEKQCMCVIMGQVPCTALVQIPKMWKGIETYQPKYRLSPYYLEPDLIEQEEEEAEDD